MYIEKHKTVGRAPSFLTGSSVFQANLVSYGANYLLLHIRYIQTQFRFLVSLALERSRPSASRRLGDFESKYGFSANEVTRVP